MYVSMANSKFNIPSFVNCPRGSMPDTIKLNHPILPLWPLCNNWYKS